MWPASLLAQGILGCFVAILCSVAEGTAADRDIAWAAKPPAIDGVLDDKVWQRAQPIREFGQPWAVAERSTSERSVTPAPEPTEARLLWDRDFLYVGVVLTDLDQLAKVTEHDGRTWSDDVFELFLRPSTEHPGYFEFQVNAIGAQFDLFVRQRDELGTPGLEKKHRFLWEAKVQRHGSLNQSDDEDSHWIVEARIPWSDFYPAGGAPAIGETWHLSMCRYDYSRDHQDPVLTTTNRATKKESPDFHEVDAYLPFRFRGPVLPESVERLRVKEGFSGVLSNLRGSPDEPPPFVGERVGSDLQINWPICVAPVPGGAGWLVIDEESPYGKSRLLWQDPAGVRDSVVLVDQGEVAYSVCFDPDFESNRFFYVGSNGRDSNDVVKSRVTRYVLPHDGPEKFEASSGMVIIDWESNGHNGAGIAFGTDGMLYVTSGDGTSDSDRNIVGQRLDHLLAKVLRIDVSEATINQPYSIPEGNPFVGLPDARPETWAYGLRNPWRITVDPVLGHVWVGNNGQDLWEQVYRVERGANYGWSVKEGGHDFYPRRQLGPTPVSKPTFDHPHSEARSLTGGVVYRGKRWPELRGAYVYGDYSTGKIWAAKVDQMGQVEWHRLIADTPWQITSFALDHDGELLISDHQAAPRGGVYTLKRREVTQSDQEFPVMLSEVGLFEDLATHEMIQGVLPYEVNSPLWSDGTIKRRFVVLPQASETLEPIRFVENGPWTFPEGTVLIKSFGLPDPSCVDEVRWIETRFMVLQQGEWAGYSYEWNQSQTDGILVEAKGADKEFVSAGSQGPFRWRYPSRTECMVCHSRAAGFVLGFGTAQLNRQGEGSLDSVNQLELLEQLGWLDGGQSESRADLMSHYEGVLGDSAEREGEKVLESKVGQRGFRSTLLRMKSPKRLVRLANPSDDSYSLDRRARAYLHSNCAHCHVEAGGGNAQIDLHFLRTNDQTKLMDVKPLHHHFEIQDARLVAPGAPERSVLLQRMARRGSGQMPQLSTNRIDAEAINLIRQWILSVPKEEGAMSRVEPGKEPLPGDLETDSNSEFQDTDAKEK